MKLNEATDFFESLKIRTSKKAEIKVYEKFLHILNDLARREFSNEEIRSIESQLDHLNLKSNPQDGKKFFKKALSAFEKFLKDTFSLTPKGYYTSLGVGLGSSFGIIFGIVFLSSLERSLGIALGISIGMLIGLIIGRTFDDKANREGRLI